MLALAQAVVRAHPCVQSVVLHQHAGRGNALLPGDVPASALTALDDDQVMGGAAGDEVLFGESFLWEDLIVRLRVSARSFLQVNREVARQIYQDVAQALAQVELDTVLDLYCGVSGLVAGQRAASAGRGGVPAGVRAPGREAGA